MVIKDQNYFFQEKTNSPRQGDYLASPVDRFAAVIIDYSIILAPILMLCISPLQRIMREERLLQNIYQVEAARFLAILAVVLLVVVYQTFFIWKWQATPGKLLMGLRVRGLEHPGSITLWYAFLRSISWVFSTLFFCIPFLTIFSHVQRRPLHDRMSETTVISVRGSRQSQKPSFTEFTFVQGIYWGLGAIVFLSLALFIYEKATDLFDKSRFISSLESQDELCIAVGEALSDWPGEQDEHTRLDVALSLYGAGLVDVVCLTQEVEKLYSFEDSYGILNLARAFVYADNPQISDAYLESLCADNIHSIECAFSRSVVELSVDSSFDDKAEMEEQSAQLDAEKQSDLNVLKNTAAIFPHVWLVRKDLREENYAAAQEHLDRFKSIQALASYHILSQARVYLMTGKENLANGIESVAYTAMDPLAQIQLSSFMCHERLWNGCDAIESSSCQTLADLTKKYDDVLSYSRVSLAILAKNECENGSTVETYEKLLTLPLNEDVRRLVEVLRESGTDGFQDFALSYSSSSLIETEAQLRLISRSNSGSLLKTILAEWILAEKSRAWMKVGYRLYVKFLEMRSAQDAIVVADELFRHDASWLNQDMLFSVIELTYQEGFKEKSYIYLQNYLNRFPLALKKSISARSPASQDKSTSVQFFKKLILEYNQSAVRER